MTNICLPNDLPKLGGLACNPTTAQGRGGGEGGGGYSGFQVTGMIEREPKAKTQKNP